MLLQAEILIISVMLECLFRLFTTDTFFPATVHSAHAATFGVNNDRKLLVGNMRFRSRSLKYSKHSVDDIPYVRRQININWPVKPLPPRSSSVQLPRLDQPYGVPVSPEHHNAHVLLPNGHQLQPSREQKTVFPLGTRGVLTRHQPSPANIEKYLPKSHAAVDLSSTDFTYGTTRTPILSWHGKGAKFEYGNHIPSTNRFAHGTKADLPTDAHHTYSHRHRDYHRFAENMNRYRVSPGTSSKHKEQADKSPCDCGPPTSTGTVIGLTGLAALFIYALSMQTIQNGRSLQQKPITERTLHSRTDFDGLWPLFKGFTWNEYSKKQKKASYKRPLDRLEDFSRRKLSSRKKSTHQSSPWSKLSVDRFRKWLTKRYQSLRKSTGSAMLFDDTNSAAADACSCQLDHFVDMLSYVPLAVLLGYSTTISTTALTTLEAAASNTSGASTTIDITINDSDVITNANNNAPTLTNSDSDVISVVAQGSPVNTNTNTASNQDSDMISNSIIGG